MKNILLLCCVLLVGAQDIIAQNEQLVIRKGDKGSYVDHKVAAKENFYSIGRSFNVHPKHLAAYNGLDMAKGLSLGQTIKVPLTDTNFNQKTNKGLPVYYVTGNNETLYRVSSGNKNVLMEKLRQWNHLSGDKLPTGTKLIVGFLTVNDLQTTAVVTQPPVTNKPDPTNQVKEVAKNDTPTKPVVQKEEPKTEKPDVEKKDSTIKREEPVNVSAVDQGFFKTYFDQQIKGQPLSKEQTMTAGVFKTSNGWSDAKYYLLMNGAVPGTIVRITNPGNNKVIYAKLLGEMTALKQNQGLNIRISNAAADALDISDTEKFIVKLNY